jgi:hypothetical protein
MENLIEIYPGDFGKVYPFKYPYRYGKSMTRNAKITNNYIDDMDLLKADIRGIIHAEYGLAADFGTVMQTANGTYRAYVYVKVLNNSNRTMTIGVKRLKIK